MPAPQIDFKAMEQRVKATLKALPKKLGAEVVNFRKQGFQGEVFKPWPKRKSPTKWGTVPKRNNRAILIDRGKLRRSIRVIRANGEQVVVGSSVPYARAHNEGLRLGLIQNVRQYERKQRLAGVAGTFGKGREFTVGAVMSVKTKRNLKPKVVRTIVTVKAHKRKIDMRIPQRQFLGQSPWLTNRLRRIVQADINRALKGN